MRAGNTNGHGMSKASETAYAKIRSAILSGAFPAGQFVPEGEFAVYCGMSRTPVREAIAQLVSETLLQRSETNRVFVPVWSDDDVEEHFKLRAYLESHCAERAAQLIAPEEIDELKRHCAFIDRAINRHPTPDISGFVEGNRRLHSTILQAARSERLQQLMRIVVSQVIIHRTAEQYTIGDMARSQTDHVDLIAAFEAADPAWAAAISNGHILRAAAAYRLYKRPGLLGPE